MRGEEAETETPEERNIDRIRANWKETRCQIYSPKKPRQRDTGCVVSAPVEKDRVPDVRKRKGRGEGFARKETSILHGSAKRRVPDPCKTKTRNEETPCAWVGRRADVKYVQDEEAKAMKMRRRHATRGISSTLANRKGGEMPIERGARCPSKGVRCPSKGARCEIGARRSR